MNCSVYRTSSHGQNTSDAYMSVSCGSMSNALRKQSSCQSGGHPNDRSAFSCQWSLGCCMAWNVSIASVAMHSSTQGHDSCAMWPWNPGMRCRPSYEAGRQNSLERSSRKMPEWNAAYMPCLLYTSDAADE